MKINELIYKLKQIRDEHGDVEVYKWELQSMSNVDFNINYINDKSDINQNNTVIIL